MKTGKQKGFDTQKSNIIKGWLKIVAGLLVFSFGVHLTIYANIGLAPWDCLGMGIARHTPLNYGLSMTTIALLVLAIDLLMKERIGFGTIIDALLTGNFVQMFNRSVAGCWPPGISAAGRCGRCAWFAADAAP